MAKKKKGTNTWADHYTRKAQKENYAARSIYKLQEIQKKTGLIAPGNTVVDLGCAPGSWLQYAAECTGPSGRVVGIDLKPVHLGLPDHATAVVGDIYELTPEIRSLMGDTVHVVISDMAPSTTGISNVDALRSAALCEAALALADTLVAPGGSFVCKIFQGPDFQPFVGKVREIFNKQKTFKPQSTRKQSREIFVIGQDRKPKPETA